MNLTRSVQNLVNSLTGKVSREQKVKNPKIDLKFEVQSLPSKFGTKLPHVVAIDNQTGTIICIAEVNDVGDCITSESQFRQDIYLFCDHVIEDFNYQAERTELNAYEQGKQLAHFTTKEFNKYYSGF